VVRQPSGWQPESGRNVDLDTAINFLKSYPTSVKTTKNKEIFNVTKRERVAINTLKNNENLIIKEADKGSAVVIMNKNYYKEKMQELLNDNQTYKIIPNNRDDGIIYKIKKYANEYSHILTKKEGEYITKFNYMTSNFYGLPKVHKSDKIKFESGKQNVEIVNIFEPEDLKFRPIVAGHSCPTSRLSHLLDLILQPFGRFVKSNIKNSVELLNKLPSSLSEGDTLATMDVTSLYSNIKHETGLTAVKYWCERYPHELNKFPIKLVLDGCRLVLENNYFQFNQENYIQILGTAMGTKFAPIYATLTLGFLEEKLFNDISINLGPSQSTNIRNKFFRYLDDVFVIWNEKYGNITLLQNFLNNLDEKIYFTCDQTGDSVSFLDVRVSKTCNNRVITDVFYKETDTKQYLNYYSNHPRYIKNNIPYNLARRICTIVSEDDLRNQRLMELRLFLKQCFYPEDLVQHGIEKALNIPQTELRREVQRNSEEAIIPYITTYDPNLDDKYGVVRNIFDFLQKCPKTSKSFKNKKLISSKRQPPNLKRLLTMASFIDGNVINTVKKCGNKRCLICTIINEGHVFVFTESNKTFTIQFDMSCNTKHCIYAMKCGGCSKTYIGETKDFRNRVNLHKQHINERADFLVSTHIAACTDDKLFTIMPIYKMKSNNDTERKDKEEMFIKKFKPSLNSKI
jgi:hypothetical protein